MERHHIPFVLVFRNHSDIISRTNPYACLHGNPFTAAPRSYPVFNQFVALRFQRILYSTLAVHSEKDIALYRPSNVSCIFTLQTFNINSMVCNKKFKNLHSENILKNIEFYWFLTYIIRPHKRALRAHHFFPII